MSINKSNIKYFVVLSIQVYNRYYIMRILFISNDLIAGNLARRLVDEGHEVKLYVHERARRGNLDFIVPKTTNWKAELPWVGKNGLIVFDDVGWGKEQSKLRKQGYTVFGGSVEGDRLETDREYAQIIFSKYGLKTKETKDFEAMYDAIEYVEKNPKAWVVKQNGHASKSINYVGFFEDGRDVLSVLKNYLTNPKINKERITLQEKINGIEIGVGRYFNGTDWVGPIEFNIEHKKFFPGDIGPTTSEMGTLAWYSEDENNKLFKEVLNPLVPYLREIDFRGDFEINCIVDEEGAWPLEATPRFGSPIIHLHDEIHVSPWGEFLYAVARGEKYDLKYKKGYGLVVLIAVPPFPYTKKEPSSEFYGMNVFFHNLTGEDPEHIHFEEISRDVDNVNQFYISDNRGYVLYVTGMGETLPLAIEDTYNRIDKVIIPKMIYRNDVGRRFMDRDEKRLRDWGYL